MPARGTTPHDRKAPEYKHVSTDLIDFDPNNPRFGGSARGLSQPSIQHMLEEEPHLATLLVDSFLENGFISYEPLVVRQEDSRFVVIEGNRRLAAVKYIIARPDKYKKKQLERLKSIPVLVFRQKTDASRRREIRNYLGVRHMVGIRDWPPKSKAMFLDEHIKSKRDVDRIVRECSMTKHEIRRYLVPYRVRKTASDVFDEFPAIEDQEFWKLGEALARVGVKEYLKLKVSPSTFEVKRLDKSKLGYLLEFLYGKTEQDRGGRYRSVGSPRIVETRQLSRLSKVLASRPASEVLERGSTLEEAEIYVESREETLQQLLKEFEMLLKNIVLLQPGPEELEALRKSFAAFETATEGMRKDEPSDV